jgi:hypothetical protein
MGRGKGIRKRKKIPIRKKNKITRRIKRKKKEGSRRIKKKEEFSSFFLSLLCLTTKTKSRIFFQKNKKQNGRCSGSLALCCGSLAPRNSFRKHAALT